jgi:hypothetical protein
MPCSGGQGGTKTRLSVRGTLSVMRLLAAAILFAVAGATAYMAWLMFTGISSDSETSADAWIALGSFWSALSLGALIGAIWVVRASLRRPT